MGDEREKSIGPWMVAVLVVLPLLYLASVGPACWASSRMNIGAQIISVFYRPLTWGMSRNKTVNKAVSWYTTFKAADDWRWKNGTWEAHPDRLGDWLYSPEAGAINRHLGVGD